MARVAATLVLSSALLLFTVFGLCEAQSVTLPNGIEAAQVDQPTQGTSDLGDNPSYTKPDETFNGNMPGVGDLNVGTNDGTTSGSFTEYPGGRKMLAQGGRKMLQASTLQLSGSGVSAGDNTLGDSANAYGQGQLDGVTDSHIEPHGVDDTATVAGQSTTTGVAADPDCLGKEGPCVEAGRK